MIQKFKNSKGAFIHYCTFKNNHYICGSKIIEKMVSTLNHHKMSTRHILFFFSTTFFLTVIMLLFNYNDLSWKGILIYTVGGLIFGLWMTLSQMRQERQYIRWPFALEDIDIDGEILQKDWMCHFHGRGIIAVTGFGLLLKDRLVFVEQKRRQLEKQFEIMFADIAYISNVKFLGIFNTGLKIALKSGKSELFKLDRKSNFYRALMENFFQRIK